MMPFDIRKHVKDHANMIIDNLIIKKNEINFIHFTTSIDTGILISKGYDTQEKIDNLMQKMLKNISEMKLEIVEKNGFNLKKDGTKTQKYRTRKIKFDKLLCAYHNQHFDDSKSVNPHFHFVGKKNARLGKNFMYLKKAIRTEAEKYGLKFHFFDKPRPTGLSKNKEAGIKKMSWAFNEGKTEKINTYLKEDNRLGKVLSDLKTHYMHTENISYFLKIMNIVNQRLNEMNIDYFYKNINLKNSISFSLTKEQESAIQSLKDEEEVEIDIAKVFDREILKYAHGFGSDAAKVLVDKFNIPPIDKNKLNIIYPDDDGDEDDEPTKSKSNFRNLVLEDIKKSINHSSDEKSMKQALLDMGYQKVSLKTTKIKNAKRQKIGMKLTTKKGMNIDINFSEIGMNWSDITTILMSNNEKNKEHEVLSSEIENYNKDEEEKDELVPLTPYEYRVSKLLTIYPSEFIEMKNVEHLAHKFNVSRSDMYDITTFTSADATIVDYADKIVLKKSDSLVENVTDMLKLAELKGWELSSLTLKGDDNFVKEAKKQIDKKLGVKKKKRKMKILK